MTLAELLGAERAAPGCFRYSIGTELHGAFGGAFGGVVAAAALMTARDAAPGRVPSSIDVRFLRGLRAGTCTAEAGAVHVGRSLSVVNVDVTAPDGKAAARATISLVEPSALHPLESTPESLLDAVGSYDEASQWPPMAGRDIPIITTLAPRLRSLGPAGMATIVRLPWTPDDTDAAEATCFAADLCVGPPVANACVEKWIPHPNPDLTLRFVSGAAVGREVVGVGRVARIGGGVAAVTVEVLSEGDVVAVGNATSLLLAQGG